jgi:AraC family transcriptional regulator, regulatory protein of adaptative response / DNA-3-methyladenine glycosylase II
MAVTLDADSCYRALVARDPRFDGRFFIGVTTTGVYCRPICSARTPRRERCTFFRGAAEAEKAGFRACFRCRPELAPGAAPIDALPRLVARALARIDEGCLDEGGVDQLAGELGVTGRHLRRALEAELGVSPVELAQTRRLALAKRLLQDSRLGLAAVAFASGFGSVRRFNAAFQERFGRPPSALRRPGGGAAPATERSQADGAGVAITAIDLRLDFREPYDWPALLAFLGARAIPGVEQVDGGVYRRVVRIGDAAGLVTVRRDPARPSLRVGVDARLAGVLVPLLARLRALFDLDAEPAAIAAALGRDRRLRAPVRRHPGLRVPGAIDAFEIAARALLGQQVSVRAATTLAGRLAARFGAPLAGEPGLERAFPTAAELARVDAGALAAIGLPRARAASLRGLAQAVAGGGLLLDRGVAPAEVAARLQALPGIGPWTAQYLCMRALRDPDAFPAGDLGVRRALRVGTERAALARAEAWRPWRAYAVMHLWTEGEPR